MSKGLVVTLTGNNTAVGDGAAHERQPAVLLSPRAGIRRVRLLAAAVAAVGVVALLLVAEPRTALEAGPTSPPLVWLLIVGGFIAAELMVFHIELRREAITMSLSEVPLAFGLVFLSPVALVAARLAAIALAKGTTLRSSPHKFLFNVPLVFTETALACLLLRALNGPDMFDSALGWLVFLGAVATPNILSAFFVGLAIAWFEGGHGRFLLRESGLDLYYPATASIAVFSVMPSLIEPALGWLPLVPMGAVWLVLRSHGRVSQRYRDLKDVVGFNATLVSSPHLEEVLAQAVKHARELLRAERMYLAVRQWDGTVSVHVDAGTDVDAAKRAADRCAFDELWGTTEPVFVDQADSDNPLSLLLAPLAYRQAIVSPVMAEGDQHGVLVAVDRSGVASRFTKADLPRVQALVRQLGSTIRNGQLHQAIEHQATYDQFTGLPNRAEFERLLTRELDQSEQLAVVLFDIGQFAEVNDTLGHTAAQELATTVADRLRSSVPGNGSVGRIGDQAFAVAVPGADRDLAANAIAAVADSLGTPYSLQGLQLSLSATSGIVLAPAHGRDASVLLRRAVVAAGVARENNRPMCTYSAEIDVHSEARLALLTDLDRALDNGELEVHYQPKLDLVGGRVASVEALIRWEHPERGFISPAEFIPTVERSASMGRVTDYVIERALETISLCRADGRELGVAVNISATDLLDDLLPDRIGAALGRWGVEPRHLTVEITETSAISDSARTRTTLGRLEGLGIKASIDDFGTGYSSLTYLRDLAVDELKVDQRFVANLLLDEEDAFIVRAVIDLAHNLQLRVVAEGVENTPTLDWLIEAGCDMGQGYGICRPLPADQLRRWLADRASEEERAHR